MKEGMNKEQEEVEREETMFYIGIKPCGCIVTACVDRPGWKKETAKSVADWIKRGFNVKRVPKGFEMSICKHKETP